MWFAGNHSDIGGSYPETDSRLSDIALEWMIGQATSQELPAQLVVDRSKLKLFPSPAGMQHCEVSGFANAHPFLSRLGNWPTLQRSVVQGVTLHPSVLDRFALPAVSQCGKMAPYRPPNLASDSRLFEYYIAAPQAAPDQDNSGAS